MKIPTYIFKPMEIISGILAAYILKHPEKKDDLDWIEIPNTPYVQELTSRININKYPELKKYIEDINDCGQYTKLSLYFDDDMNFTPFENMNTAFNNNDASDYAKLVKDIYDNEKLNDIFPKYQNEFDYITDIVQTNIPDNLDISDIEKFYGHKKGNLHLITSTLMNGGFGFNKNDDLYYYQGIRQENNKYHLPSLGILVTLFHEYSHSYTNPIVLANLDNFENKDKLLNEAIENGLPQCYYHDIALLYEYFVRANSIVLAKKYLNDDFILDEIDYNEKIGFIHIRELINIIIQKRDEYPTYEALFTNELIPYINEKSKNNTMKP